MASDDDTGSERTLGEGRFLRLVRRGKWEFVERTNVKGVVGIVATTDDGKLVLVEQWREPVRKWCIELPAGLVGDEDASEETEASAARELEEETGYRAGWMEHLCDGVSSAGLSGETIALYRAGGLVRIGEGGGTSNEQIQVHTVPFAKVQGFLESQVMAGKAVDLKAWMAVWLMSR